MTVEVLDPVADYKALMAHLFDFAAIRAMFAGGFRMRFDAMHAITGPYATAILEGELGAPAGTVVNGTPLPDFGGHHPDPNLVHAKELYDLLMGPDAPDIGAASDGDGDRNLIIGRGMFVTPSDSVAMLAANAHLAPATRAASRASPARCRPAQPPTAWPSASASPATRPPRAGSSSATCSTPARSRSAARRVPAPAPTTSARRTGSGPSSSGSTSWQPEAERRRHRREHWRTYGRNYYSRHDYEEVDSDAANGLMAHLRGRLGLPARPAPRRLRGRDRRRLRLHRPGRRLRQRKQGVRVVFADGSASSTASPAPAPPAPRCASTSSATSPTPPARARRRKERSPA
jgi:phosphoglucomutase